MKTPKPKRCGATTSKWTFTASNRDKWERYDCTLRDEHKGRHTCRGFTWPNRKKGGSK